MCTILQRVGQIGDADQVYNDGASCKLCQVGLDQRDFFLNLGTLVQNTQKSLSKTNRMVSAKLPLHIQMVKSFVHSNSF